MNGKILLQVRGNWSRVLAFAWLNSDVLIDLRKDPKNTIIKLAGETNSHYQNVDRGTEDAAKNIIVQTEQDGSEAYRGYLPIPDPLKGLENLDLEDDKLEELLEELLLKGITGILKFDKKANLWKEELKAAWTSQEKLIQIRKDPLNILKYAKELSEDEFGIFPLPDLPSGLENLKIEELQNFLGDEDNMEHLGGIFLVGS